MQGTSDSSWRNKEQSSAMSLAGDRYQTLGCLQGVVQGEIHSCRSGAALWQGPGKWVSLSLEISKHQLDGALNDLL